MVVGGGGYTMRNVARTWSFEAGLLNNIKLPQELPYNDYYEYYGPDYKLDVRPSNINLENTKHAPSVQMNEVPRDAEDLGDVEEDTAEALDTKGGSQQARDEIIQPDNEFYDEDDKDKEERNINEESKPTDTDGDVKMDENSEKPVVTEEEMKEINDLNSEN
ncbi:histone deacetylase [Cerrena zonata]|uniref:Histone deacetylase n=1 Tax=Cerrena zonata TaxID=2478898 RepID=A0AAW0F9T9_9APHY